MSRISLWLGLAAVCAGMYGGVAPAAAAPTSWVLPTDGPPVVRRPFQPPPVDWRPGHRGVDLAGRPGEPVRAAGAGTVTFAGVLAGRGVVTVQHGPLRTTYEPVTPAVGVGARVALGQVLGHLARGHGAPRPGEALLHWGLRRGEAYFDPMSLLRASPPRLLPHWSRGAPAAYRPWAGASAPRAAAADATSRSGRSAATSTLTGVAALTAGTAGAAGAVAVRRRRAVARTGR